MLTRKALANNTVKDTISSTSTAHGLLLPVKFYLDELCSCSSTQAGRQACRKVAGRWAVWTSGTAASVYGTGCIVGDVCMRVCVRIKFGC